MSREAQELAATIEEQLSERRTDVADASSMSAAAYWKRLQTDERFCIAEFEAGRLDQYAVPSANGE